MDLKFNPMAKALCLPGPGSHTACPPTGVVWIQAACGSSLIGRLHVSPGAAYMVYGPGGSLEQVTNP